MTHGSLFSGMGGFDLAAEWMGWENIFHCEWKPFNQRILKYYWPNAISYSDITKTDFSIHRGTIDIITGGFPCQPYSVAGKRKGKEDDRHLWPEMLRAIREIQPAWVVGENVRGIINWSGGLVFDEVQAQLEVEGYEVLPFLLPAAGVNAPHERYRTWFVAYSGCKYSTLPVQQWRQDEAKDINADRQVSSGNATDTNQFNGDLSGFCSSGISQQQETGVFQDPTNSDSKGFQAFRERSRVQEEEGQTCTSAERSGLLGYPGNWEGWPTVSPVCERNDGFPRKLDGISFSKWRTESIMSGGNAIVPQVALQIFKAIQQYQILNP